MTPALLLLPAGVKVTFIFTFTRVNIIGGIKSSHISLHLCNDAIVVSLWVFMGVMHGCLWVFMSVYGYLWVFMSFCGCLWVYIGVDGVLWVYGCLWVSWVSMCLWVSICVCGFLGVYGCLWVSGSMGIYGCLCVLYLNMKNIAYFLIQETQKI